LRVLASNLPDRDPDRDRRFFLLSLAGSILTGLVLRLWNLSGQVMGGDELHAVRAAAKLRLPEILTTYSLADHSIPLTALYRVMMAAGLTLSEIDFRLPALVCGCAALAVLPLLVVARMDRAATAALGWLVAISPGLVLYSRIARSYLPMVLAGWVAVFAFEAWWRTGERRYAFLYIGLGGLAVWLHLGAGPFVASPFLFALGDLAWTREDKERWRRLGALAAVGIGLALAMAAFLVPARSSLLALIAVKRRSEPLSLAALGNLLRLQAGTASAAVTLLFWLAAVAGLVLLIRHRPRFAAFTLTVAAGHFAGLLVLSPLGLANALVLNRYLLPLLPLALLWLAFGLSRVWRPAAVAFVLLLAWAGPFTERGFLSSSFMHHNDFVAFFAPRATMPAEIVPAVYRRLPEGPVVEAPWPTAWNFCRSFYLEQEAHRRGVLVSAPFGIPRDPHIQLRNEVPSEPAALLASPARTVIVHVRLGWEEDRIAEPPERPALPMRPIVRRQYRKAGEQLAARLTAEWGPPDFADASVRVWDLKRVRGVRHRRR
jgi:hypothetical protein